jgi:hypothetical protein
LKQNRIARVLFYIDNMGRMVLLHWIHREDAENNGRGFRAGEEQPAQT